MDVDDTSNDTKRQLKINTIEKHSPMAIGLRSTCHWQKASEQFLPSRSQSPSAPVRPRLSMASSTSVASHASDSEFNITGSPPEEFLRTFGSCYIQLHVAPPSLVPHIHPILSPARCTLQASASSPHSASRLWLVELGHAGQTLPNQP